MITKWQAWANVAGGICCDPRRQRGGLRQCGSCLAPGQRLPGQVHDVPVPPGVVAGKAAARAKRGQHRLHLARYSLYTNCCYIVNIFR
jgi:hypothetical protein